MNYEELYSNLQNLEKDLKDKQASALKQYKNSVKNTETGDIKSSPKIWKRFPPYYLNNRTSLNS